MVFAGVVNVLYYLFAVEAPVMCRNRSKYYKSKIKKTSNQVCKYILYYSTNKRCEKIIIRITCSLSNTETIGRLHKTLTSTALITSHHLRYVLTTL